MENQEPRLTSEQERLERSREEMQHRAEEDAGIERDLAMRNPSEGWDASRTPKDFLHEEALTEDYERERAKYMPNCSLNYSRTPVEGSQRLMDYHITGKIEDGREIDLFSRYDYVYDGTERQADVYKGTVGGVEVNPEEANKLFRRYFPEGGFGDETDTTKKKETKSDDQNGGEEFDGEIEALEE